MLSTQFSSQKAWSIKMLNIFGPARYKGKWGKLSLVRIVALVVVLLVGFGGVLAGEVTRGNDWPKFGLVFQNVKNYRTSSQRFWFFWGDQKTASQLRQTNDMGIYLPVYNLVRACLVFSKIKLGPDYELITVKHPDWIMRYKDGSQVLAGPKGLIGPRLDLGNPAYVNYVIEWLSRQAFSGSEPVRDVGLDNAMFMYADKRWAKYDSNETYRVAWEDFLRRISEALRPQHKVILNVGGCDLPTFARMIRLVDGVLHEDLCVPPQEPKYDPDEARQMIQDRWQKGQWCSENGKIWAVRYRGTINALKLESAAGTHAVTISVSDREIIIMGSGQKILGRLNFSSLEVDTLAKLTVALKKFNLKASILSPYPETATLGTIQPMIMTRVDKPLTLKLKQAPKEAFLFGYAAVLMAAGPNSYFILGDERRQEYYYPEMDWPVGSPLGPKKEIAPQVYHRAFAELDAYLNLSDSPFLLPDGHTLLPFRGALIKKVK